MRTMLALGLCTIAATAHADNSREIMELLLKNSDLVILGEVVDNSNGGVSMEFRSICSCKIKIIDVLKGQSPAAETIKAEIDVVRDHPYTPPKLGDKRVYFLSLPDRTRSPAFVTNDVRFCVQPASMASELKRLALEMRRLEIAQPIR